MHLPEAPGRRGGLGEFRRAFSVRMSLTQRKVTKNKTQSIAHLFLHCLDLGIGLATVRAFEVAVFDEYYPRITRPLDVIAFADWGC
jgi:hypothetical protein